MEPEEEIYVNLKDLVHTEPGGGSGVENHQQEPETRTPLKMSAVVLALLSLVLLVLVVRVSVLYDRDFNQLSRELTNQTGEKNQLQNRNQNLTEEVDRLESRINRLENAWICPRGWKRFGCSCYQFSTLYTTWQSSQQNCLRNQADLVIINSREEMEFLNELGVSLKFWIGLKNSMGWKWTIDRSPTPDFWQNGHPVGTNQRYQWNQLNQNSFQDYCGAFNSFKKGSFYYPIKSWTSELCSTYLQSVCEKEAVPSGLL
ncbi:C-type lectin domain family 6 member A-like [Oryzias melastigma]|nr:C-type lectin domain family 6 member A-like [Oryzias melastigma]